MLRCEWLIGLHQQDTVCLIKTAFLEYQGRFFFFNQGGPLEPAAPLGHQRSSWWDCFTGQFQTLPLKPINPSEREETASTQTFLPSRPLIFFFRCFLSLPRCSHFLSSLKLLKCKRWFFFLSLERNLPTPRSAQGSPCWTSATNASVVPALLPN